MRFALPESLERPFASLRPSPDSIARVSCRLDTSARASSALVKRGRRKGQAQGQLQPTLRLVLEEASDSLLAIPLRRSFERILRGVFAKVVNLPALREVVHDFFGLSARHGFLLPVTGFVTAFLAAFLAFVLSALHYFRMLCHVILLRGANKKPQNVCDRFEAERSHRKVASQNLSTRTEILPRDYIVN